MKEYFYNLIKKVFLEKHHEKIISLYESMVGEEKKRFETNLGTIYTYYYCSPESEGYYAPDIKDVVVADRYMDSFLEEFVQKK